MNIVENQPHVFPRFSEDEKSGELECYKFLNERLKPKVVFSVGAQKDFEFCKAFNESEIHLFDPNKFAFRELLNNEYLFNRPKTFLNFYGLGNKESYFIYYFNGESVYNHDGKNEKDKIFISTLKRYIEPREINEIDFLKVDVEGFEYEVIKGAEELLDNINVVQFEYGERYPIANKTLKMMYDLFPDRYMYHIEEDKINLVPYKGEYFQYSNYLASKIKF
jgi:FkbM family methyltransferase